MKGTIFVNTMDRYITDQQIVEVMEALTDPFYGKFVSKELEVSVSLWDVRASMSGYGHWKITCDLELNFAGNKKKVVLTKTTTDSEAIDNRNDSGDDARRAEGYLSLFTECLYANESDIYEALDIED